MYVADFQNKDVSNKDKDNAQNVNYKHLHNRFQSENCLNLNNCISDDSANKTLVINTYLEKKNDPYTKEEL